jgi:hypothetical protein
LTLTAEGNKLVGEIRCSPPASQATIEAPRDAAQRQRPFRKWGFRENYLKGIQMKRIAVCLLLLSVCVALPPAAWASWGSFVSTGVATAIGTPSCAQVSTGQVACAVRSGKSVIMVNQFNGAVWGTWKSLAGAVSSDPSCTSDGTGKVICAASATNGNLLVTIFSGGIWSVPVKVAASLFSAPSCAETTAGRVLCVARNATGGLAWSVFNGTAWSAFANLTTSAVSAPSCTTDNAGGVICSVFTSGSATLVNRFSGGTWAGFLNIGGLAGGEPDCTSMNSGGKVVCFAKAFSSGVFGALFKGGAWVIGDWNPYAGIGGSVNENASCTSHVAGQLVCGVIAIDNVFYANVFNGAAWSGWAKIGGTGVGTPSCAPLGTGQVVCAVLGINNKLTSVVGP